MNIAGSNELGSSVFFTICSCTSCENKEVLLLPVREWNLSNSRQRSYVLQITRTADIEHTNHKRQPENTEYPNHNNLFPCSTLRTLPFYKHSKARTGSSTLRQSRSCENRTFFWSWIEKAKKEWTQGGPEWMRRKSSLEWDVDRNDYKKTDNVGSSLERSRLLLEQENDSHLSELHSKLSSLKDVVSLLCFQI